MKDLLKLIKIGNYEFPVQISSDAEDLVRKLLHIKPTERLTLPEILNHPWMKEGGDETEEEGDESDASKSSTP